MHYILLVMAFFATATLKYFIDERKFTFFPPLSHLQLVLRVYVLSESNLPLTLQRAILYIPYWDECLHQPLLRFIYLTKYPVMAAKYQTRIQRWKRIAVMYKYCTNAFEKMLWNPSNVLHFFISFSLTESKIIVSFFR